jgi:LuxR family maltose regulon positive regulatory protein
MDEGPPYLRSKLMPPNTRPVSVSRRRPEQLLDLGVTSRLTLVDAPPGWGKTTVVARWLQSHEGHRPAWLSLDPEDDDPAHFWSYVIEALGAGHPGFGERSRSALRVSRRAATEELLPALLDDLDHVDGEGMVLVIDDYHLISSPQIHAGVIFLIEHLTPRHHLVVITRSDPPFPLARWRVRGQVTEVRVDDLRFDTEDTGRLLSEVLAIPLEPSSITRLQARTEGWVAGLLLAALSLRDRADPADFVEGFAGDDRHIVDYLGSEVLDSLDQQTRRFLVRTSIVDRLTGPLCDAITQAGGSDQILAGLERSNLFVTRLDNRAEWFRYHQLFAELLRVELQRSEGPALAGLHSRAARWYIENGLIPETIRHTVATGDIAGAADLLAQRWGELLQRGDLADITRALDCIGEEAVRVDPRLCLVRAWMTINLGRVPELIEWIEAAERALKDWPASESIAFQAAAGMLRCIEQYLTGDAGAAIDAARQALDLETVELPPWRSVGCPVLGIALYWSGQLNESKSTLLPAVRRAAEAGNFLAQLHGTGCLALAAAVAQDYATAAQLISRATDLRHQHGFPQHWASAMSLLAQGRLAMATGDPDGAEAAISTAVDLSRRGLARIELAYGLLELAAVQFKQSRADAAAVSMAEAEHALAHCPDPGVVASLASELARQVGQRPAPGALQPHLYGERLSPREAAVLALLPSDLSLRDIAASLSVSTNTLKTQTRAIYRKLGATNRTEAVDRARALGLA